MASTTRHSAKRSARISAEVGVLSSPGRSPRPGTRRGCKRRRPTPPRARAVAACAPAGFLVRSKSARRGQNPDRNPPTNRPNPNPKAQPLPCLKLVPAGGAVDVDLPDHSVTPAANATSQSWEPRRTPEDDEAQRPGEEPPATNAAAKRRRTTELVRRFRHGAERSAGDVGEPNTDGERRSVT